MCSSLYVFGLLSPNFVQIHRTIHQIFYITILQNVVKKFSYQHHYLIVSYCALTVCVNVQHFSINGVCWYFISRTYQADSY